MATTIIDPHRVDGDEGHSRRLTGCEQLLPLAHRHHDAIAYPPSTNLVASDVDIAFLTLCSP